MSSLFKNRYKPDWKAEQPGSVVQSVTASGDVQVIDGDLKYVGEQGGNTDFVAYQEVSGAPIETHSPLGYNVGPFTIVFLNLSKMVGTGIDPQILESLSTLIYFRNILDTYVEHTLTRDQ